MKKQSLVKTGFKIGLGFYVGWELGRNVDELLDNCLKRPIVNKVNEIKHRNQTTNYEECETGFKIGFQPDETK